MSTTLGKELIRQAIPEDMRRKEWVFDKKGLGAFYQELAESHPEEYVEVLHKLNNVARVAGTEYGGIASQRLRDLRLPPKTREYRTMLQGKVRAIAQNPSISGEEKQRLIVATLTRAMPTIKETLENELKERENVYGESIRNGWRGSMPQLIQLLFGDMLVPDNKGRPIPIPGLHSYGEGTTPAEYWAGSYASRSGYASVQFATGKSGYLSKQLAVGSQNVRVTGEDCGAEDVGILGSGDDPDIIGSVLARDIEGLPAGTVLDKNNIKKLAGKKPLLRSLLTCQQPEGICQKCSGKRDQNRFPPIGAFVGVESSRVIAEPLTQMALSSKHTGGLVKGQSDDISGFEEVNQFTQVPEYFRGAAVLAPLDGKVRQVVKAPQGGHYLFVGDTQVYIPPTRKLSVSPGDTVEAGDVLTDGTPNPEEITRHKGLGEGRLYFQTKFSEILRKNGVETHPRNVEVLSRSLFDRIRITSPDGVMGHIIGDVVPYSDLQRDYTPRKGTETRPVGRGAGMYLEKPVLHYTIGTRITPKMTAFLKQEGIGDVLVHKDPPGFEPEIVRVSDIPAKDPDWKARMTGFNLRKGFLDAARMGAMSPKKGPSFVSELMDPTRI
jgi:DNA-directed RNA polymerase subunit beta'